VKVVKMAIAKTVLARIAAAKDAVADQQNE